MKKIILLLLLIPIVSLGQKKSLLTKSGVSLTFDKPEGMKESPSGPAMNPNVLVQYLKENNTPGGYTIIANIIDDPRAIAEINNMKKEDLYKILAQSTFTETDNAGNSNKLIDVRTMDVKGKLFGWSLTETNSIAHTVTYYYYIKNTAILISGTNEISSFENFYIGFIDFVSSIEIN